MAQLININSTEFRRCNLSAIQSGGTWASLVPDENEIILISTTNALTAVGSGECDAYIVGDGTTAASALEIKDIIPHDDDPVAGSNKLITSGGCEAALRKISDELNGVQAEQNDITSLFTFETGKAFNEDSIVPTTSSNGSYSETPVYVGTYDEVIVACDNYINTSSDDKRACLLLDNDLNILAALSWHWRDGAAGYKELVFDVSGTEGAKYLLVSYSQYNCQSGVYITGKINGVEGIAEKVEAIDEEIRGEDAVTTDLLSALTIANGYLYPQTSITPTRNTSSNYSTTKVDISLYDRVVIACELYQSAGTDNRYCHITDENDTILASLRWVGEVTPAAYKELVFDLTTIPNAKYLYVSYGRNNCTSGIVVTGIKDGTPSLPERVARLEQDAKDVDYIHISFDDMAAPFQWLADNYSTATSIFNEAFFALMKTLHETYGAVFTLNCFVPALQALATAGNKFAAEFRNNADWLKFAFHAYGAGISYAENTTHTYRATAQADYLAFVTAIRTFTGGVVNIHQVTRLGYYEGDAAKVLEIKNQPMGAYGLLCSDDSRDSYYLDADICNLIRSRGHWYDAEHSMYFISTNAPRFDLSADITESDAYNTAKSALTGLSFAELFMHQTTFYSDPSTDTLYQSRGNVMLEQICVAAKEIGFEPSFTQFHLKNY